jgi:hypothetical protein
MVCFVVSECSKIDLLMFTANHCIRCIEYERIPLSSSDDRGSKSVTSSYYLLSDQDSIH